MSRNPQVNSEFIDALKPVHDDVFRFARHLTGSYDDAFDLTADAVMNALVNWDRIKDKSALRAYLCTSVRRAYNRLRWKRRLFEKTDRIVVEETFVGTITEVERGYDSNVLQAALDRLRPTYRSCLVLIDVQDLPIAEAAKISGLSEGGMKARLFRAREALARELGVQRKSKPSVQTLLQETSI